MAGVSPSRGGSNASTIGMVVSIVVAVILAGVLIWLFTMQEGLRTAAQNAEQQKNRIARPGEDNKLKSKFPEMGLATDSVAGTAIKGTEQLIQSLAGDGTLTAGVAQGAYKDTLKTIQDAKKVKNPEQYSAAEGATAIIKNLHEEYATAIDRVNQLSSELKDKEDALQAARDANKELSDKFDSYIARIDKQVEEILLAKTKLEENKNAELASSRDMLDRQRDDLNATKRAALDMKEEIQKYYRQSEAVLASQSDALGTLKGPINPNARPLAKAKRAFGQILKILPGDPLMYIDVGRKDGVDLGQTFSVYSANEVIPESGRGKATIEVVSVNRSTAECRIVAAPSPDDPILQGDKVNNIILSRDKGKQQTFVVVGDFDVDFDGDVDPRGREMIVRHIERLGGKVEQEVTPFTSYVVIGAEPRGQSVVNGIGRPRFGSDEADALLAKEVDKKDAKKDDKTDEAAEEKDPDFDDFGWGGDDSSSSSDDKDKEKDDGDKDKDDDKDSDDDGWGGDDDGWGGGSDDDSGDKDKDDDKKDDEDSDSDDDDDWGGDDDWRRYDGGDGGTGGSGVFTIDRKPEVNPTVPTLKKRYSNEADRYRDALYRANAFSVPLLTQEQFFNYIGIEGTRKDVRRLEG